MAETVAPPRPDLDSEERVYANTYQSRVETAYDSIADIDDYDRDHLAVVEDIVDTQLDLEKNEAFAREQALELSKLIVMLEAAALGNRPDTVKRVKRKMQEIGNYLNKLDEGKLTDAQKVALVTAVNNAVESEVQEKLKGEVIDENLGKFILESRIDLIAGESPEDEAEPEYEVVVRVIMPGENEPAPEAEDKPEGKYSREDLSRLAADAKDRLDAKDKEGYTEVLEKMSDAINELHSRGMLDGDEIDSYIETINTMPDRGGSPEGYPKLGSPEAKSTETDSEASDAVEDSEIENDSETTEAEKASAAFMKSPEFKRQMEGLTMDLDDARNRMATASASLRLRFRRKGNLNERYEQARRDYDAAELAIRNLIRDGYEQEGRETEDFDRLMRMGNIMEWNATTKVEQEAFMASRYGRFLEKYANASKKKKLLISMGMIGAGVAATVATGGFAAVGAATGAGIFGRGFMSYAGRQSYANKAKQDEAELRHRNAASHGEAGLVGSLNETRVSKDQKRMRIAAGIGAGAVAFGAFAGDIVADKIGDGLDATGDFFGGAKDNLADSLNDLADRDVSPSGTSPSSGPAFEFDLGDGGAGEAAGSAADATTGAFVDNVDAGEGITHSLRDLAMSENIEGLSSQDLYSVYEQFEGDFGALDGTYQMANGDFGISAPGEFTIPAELNSQVVDALHERAGDLVDTGDVATAAADTTTEIGDAATAIEAPADVAVDVPDVADAAPEGPFANANEVAFQDSFSANDSIETTIGDYLKQQNPNISDAEITDVFDQFTGRHSNDAVASMFPGSSDGIYTTSGTGGITQRGIANLNDIVRSR